MKTGNLLNNIKNNNTNLEKRYDILLKLIENEDKKVNHITIIHYYY